MNRRVRWNKEEGKVTHLIKTQYLMGTWLCAEWPWGPSSDQDRLPLGLTGGRTDGFLYGNDRVVGLGETGKRGAGC